MAEVLGPSDGRAGPGDDGAVVDLGGISVVVGGEALYPPFVEADPFGAGVAAVVANVNDLAAMGARPLGLVDTVTAPESHARRFLEGLRHGAALYGVAVLGGHLTVRDGPASAAAFGVGRVADALSSRSVAAGQALLVASCLEGALRPDFPFFSSVSARGHRLAGDVSVLADLAARGACLAAKDVSMAGVLGSLAMLLEPTGTGATVDLDRIPRPAGVPLEAWLPAFPTFSFLLCVPPGKPGECRRAFDERGLACEIVGEIDDSGEIRVGLGDRRVTFYDVRREPVTGLRWAQESGAAAGEGPPATA